MKRGTQDVSKLPKWAQEMIRRLESDLAYRIDAHSDWLSEQGLFTPKDYDPCHGINIPVRNTAYFETQLETPTAPHAYIMVQHKGDHIYIQGSIGQLNIKPVAGNCIRVTQVAL